MKKNIKILVIRLSSMGDIVLTTAFIRLLKKHFADAEIHFLLKKQFADIYRYNPNISEIIEYDISKPKSGIMDENERSGKYDLIFDLQNNRRSKYFRLGLGEKTYSVKKNYLNKLSLVYLKKPLHNEIKTIHSKYMDTARDYDLVDDNNGLEIWLEKDRKNNQYLSKTPKNIIAIAPGAYHYTKRWLPERYIEITNMILKELSYDIILLGGNDDRQLCNKIASISPRVTSYAGETSILETTELLNNCKAIITNDTGVMHIAAARQVPVVSIFGSTVKEFGFAPFRVKHILIETELDCRPCTHIGRSKCPKKHFKCMRDISTSEVYEALKKILNME